ncbi:MAG: hypothetical protein VR75_00265 [Hyphomonadaceae bacterium BRH_c29]|nr:MAG: hypothetical protein VR75_00265 [Hyphomonadaceae bacterium BRH_c29]
MEYVIGFGGRVGSSYLEGFLNSQPDCMCVGEVFTLGQFERVEENAIIDGASRLFMRMNASLFCHVFGDSRLTVDRENGAEVAALYPSANPKGKTNVSIVTAIVRRGSWIRISGLKFLRGNIRIAKGF